MFQLNKHHVIFTAAVLAVGGLGLSSFGQDQAGTAQQAQQPSGAAAPAQPAAPANSDPSIPAARTAGATDSAAIPATSEVRQTLAQTAQTALDKDQIKNISQQFAQSDQARLKDFDAKQLGAAIDQVRAAYKEKYQQDLDVTKNADKVFTEQFFRVGGAGEARTASERIGGDAAAGAGASPTGAPAGATGTPQKDAAGVAAAARDGQAAGEAARAAAASAGPAVAVVIPASHDLPETRLNLVKEGGSWKIDLPESIDAQALNRRLSEHLQMAVQMKDKWPADATEASQAISHHVFAALGSDSSAGAGGTGATGARGSSDATGIGTGAGSSGAGTGTSTGPQTPAGGASR